MSQPARQLVSELIADAIADARGDAAVLRRAGNSGQAEYLERLCDRLRGACEDVLRWLSENETLLKSGWTERTMQRRFALLEESGLARWREGHREFLSCGVPQRADRPSAYDRGAAIGRASA